VSRDFDELVEELQRQALEQAREHYSETFIDHWLHPRNPGAMDDADGHGRITGPCGDTMEIFLRVKHDTITRAGFLTDGCATTMVSASMAVELATGKSIKQALAISQDVILEHLGGLPEESQHCALLAANTLRAAIEDCAHTRNAPWKRLYRPS
jgi:nitrogen fixation NifU-like protein